MSQSKQIHLPPQEISLDVLKEKYAADHERTIEDVQYRVAKALASNEDNPDAHIDHFVWAMQNGFVPAGRINAAAGKDNLSTLINCFVQGVGDTVSGDQNGVVGIYPALQQAAETMRRGGGVGYNFSEIRPFNARVKGTSGRASGPVSYMRVFDRSCETVEAAGCFTGDTLIMTTEGYIPIKEIVESDKDYYVVTHSGNRKVTHKFSNGKKKVYKVISQYGYQCKVTEDHKFAQLGFGLITTNTLKSILDSADRHILILAPNNYTNIQGDENTITENYIKGTRRATAGDFFIPDEILTAPSYIQIAYLAGIFDTIGCFNEYTNTLTIERPNHEDLEKLQLFLLSFGIGSYIDEMHPTLTIDDFTALTAFSISINRRMFKQIKITQAKNNLHYPINGYQLFKDGIRHIEELGMEETYDLEVEDVHLLCANGIYTSNSRRGAQMAVLDVSHPDIETFIKAKQTKGELVNFNVSVGVTDDFMRAVENDEDYELVHIAEPIEELKKEGAYLRDDGLWVYKKVRAREIWEQIMLSTYDYAEPGVIFLDRINQENNLYYCEQIKSTNPCVSKNTWVMTDEGPLQVKDLIHKPFNVIVDGVEYRTTDEGFFKTDYKEVLKLNTIEGYSIEITDDHLVYLINKDEPVQVNQLSFGDKIRLHDHKFITWDGEGKSTEGYALGLFIGQGYFNHSNKEATIVISRLEDNNDIVQELDYEDIINLVDDALITTDTLITSTKLYDQVIPYFNENTLNTDQIEKFSYEFYRGFIVGIIDSNCCIFEEDATYIKKGVYISTVNFCPMQVLLRMLLRMNIVGEIIDCEGEEWIRINEASLYYIKNLFGFSSEYTYQLLNSYIENNDCDEDNSNTYATFSSVECIGKQDVYDVQVPGINVFDGNGFYLHNCGEQPLPPYGCCCLGSINLTKFVEYPFTDQANFNTEVFRDVVKYSIRMLDNVLDVTVWPLKEQYEEAMAKRRVGLGYIGLGDTLIMMNKSYETEEGREFAEWVTSEMRDAAYAASIELAKEKGTFPLFNKELYLKSQFIERLPTRLKEGIKEYGVRNSHLLSIAPTGTISLAFADNASGGIEPAFSWTYSRKKRMPDDTFKLYDVEDHAYRLYKYINGKDAALTPYFVSALDMSVDSHFKMAASVVPYIDSAISKTVNVPVDYPYEDFKSLYMKAWKAKLKGITTYRPSGVRGAILEVKPEPSKVAEPMTLEDDELNNGDQRLILKDIKNPPLESLKWPSRPTLPSGTSAWVSTNIQTPLGCFVLTISDKDSQPFEVWINRGDAPRGLDAIAKSLSIDMRSRDRKWLKMKLDALAEIEDRPFILSMPPNGDNITVNGAVAAMAKLISWRVDTLNHVEENSVNTLMDALFINHEVKTSTDGTLGWVVDVRNPSTNDEFKLILPELELPDGTRRPYGVILSGYYPKTLDGLCRVLTFDMRITDPTWINMKLKKLLDYAEPRGDFLAKLPGSDKQQNYPSTVAYIAKLILHRYEMLGIKVQEPQMPVTKVSEVVEAVGAFCSECKTYSMIKIDGCSRCTHCGAIGHCG